MGSDLIYLAGASAIIGIALAGVGLRLYSRLVVLETRFAEHRARSDARLKRIEDKLDQLLAKE